jgi:pectin methylesterase-like acyl-CoA thioesterase
MVKRIRTLLTLFLLVMGTGLSWAGVTKCTWDFSNSNCPAGAAAIEKNSGTVASDVEGVELYVDATNGKFNSKARTSDIQINANTIIQIPVKTNKDQIEISNFSDPTYAIGYTIGSNTVTKNDGFYKYIATDADVKLGYATMTVTESGYAKKIVVKQNEPASSGGTSEPERVATWDWQNGVPSSIGSDTSYEGNSGEIGSDVAGVALDVDATAGKFKYNSSGYVQFNANTVVNVPVRSAGDVVTVVSYPGQYKYTVAGVAASADKTVYKATDTDAKAGYVSIIATSTAYLYSISVKQVATTSETPSTGEKERVATWDWQNGVPSSIGSDTSYEGNSGEIDSDVEGVALDVDATAGKFKYNSSGYVQFNANTVVNVPVRSAGDVVTVVSYPGQYKYTVAGVAATADKTVYKATDADAKAGYVSIIATSTAYLYSISVKQVATTPETPSTGDKERVATWDWQNGVPSSIGSDTSYEGNSGEIDSDVEGVALDVDATAGKFKYNSSGYVQFNANTVVNVPVRSAGDVVTVVSYPGQYKYTVAGVAASADKTIYTATAADVKAGYVSIIATSTAYLYSISVLQIATGSEAPENPDVIEVAANSASDLLKAIEKANKTGNKTIYLPNGTYNLGSVVNTEINADNIAIIGESRDGVIIKNTPAEEGLQTSATLKNTSTGLYLQNLTLQCYAPYEAASGTERGVALWDKGTKTICKNVYLKGKQDVYYSNGAEGMKAYFEGGIIEGSVDFLCGSGNVLFNSVTLNVVSGTNSGNIIAAPSTYPSESGYVFANCLIKGNSGYYLARGWKAHETASSAATFIATNMMSAPNSAYWGATMGEGMTRRFSAFDASGNVVKKDAAADPTVVSKASLVAFAGSWDPAAIISQHSPIKTNAKGWASYTAFTDVYLSGATAYVAIKINEHSVLLRPITNIPAGTPVFIKGDANSKYNVSGALSAKKPETNYLRPILFDTQLTAANNAYVLGTKNGQPGLYKVASNVKVPAGKCYLYVGGASFSLDGKEMLELVVDETGTTGIDYFVAEEDADATRYNLAGQKVGKGYKGLVVRKGGKKYFAK